MSPVLSLTESSARVVIPAPPRCRQHADSVADALQPVGAPERHGLREQFPFGLMDALSKRRRIVVHLDGDSLLEHDRPAVGLATLEQLHSAPGHPDTARQGSLDCVHATGKGREQRRVHVDDGVGVGVEELVAQDPVVSGAYDETDAHGLEPRADLAVAGLRITTEVRLRQRHRRHAPTEGHVKCVRAAPVRDHQRHSSGKCRVPARLQERIEVGPCSGHQHADLGPFAHFRMTRRVPDWGTTSPMRQTGIPAAEAISGTSGGTITTMPTPMLKVRHISSRCTPPAF